VWTYRVLLPFVSTTALVIGIWLATHEGSGDEATAFGLAGAGYLLIALYYGFTRWARQRATQAALCRTVILRAKPGMTIDWIADAMKLLRPEPKVDVHPDRLEVVGVAGRGPYSSGRIYTATVSPDKNGSSVRIHVDTGLQVYNTQRFGEELERMETYLHMRDDTREIS
jgi:hypothetical protein